MGYHNKGDIIILHVCMYACTLYVHVYVLEVAKQQVCIYEGVLHVTYIPKVQRSLCFHTVPMSSCNYYNIIMYTHIYIHDCACVHIITIYKVTLLS